jgi:hypothetical protein
MADAVSSTIGRPVDEQGVQQLTDAAGRSVRSDSPPVVDVAITASIDALPEWAVVREIAAAAGVSLGMLQGAFAKASRSTPVVYV